MKDWSYYCETETPYCAYPEFREMLRARRKEIDEKPLTAVEREHALAVAEADVRLRQARQNEKHYAELNAKQAEFFRDLREDLRYGEFLTEEGCGECVMAHVGKKHAGRILDGREWSEFPTP